MKGAEVAVIFDYGTPRYYCRCLEHIHEMWRSRPTIEEAELDAAAHNVASHGMSISGALGGSGEH